MSGLNQQFTKLSAFTGPRVRISLSPQQKMDIEIATAHFLQSSDLGKKKTPAGYVHRRGAIGDERTLGPVSHAL